MKPFQCAATPYPIPRKEVIRVDHNSTCLVEKVYRMAYEHLAPRPACCYPPGDVWKPESRYHKRSDIFGNRGIFPGPALLSGLLVALWPSRTKPLGGIRASQGNMARVKRCAQCLIETTLTFGSMSLRVTPAHRCTLQSFSLSTSRGTCDKFCFVRIGFFSSLLPFLLLRKKITPVGFTIQLKRIWVAL